MSSQRPLWMVALLLVALLGGTGSARAFDFGRAITGIKKANDVRKKVKAANKPISPEEEYYIGRSVAATVIGEYGVLKNEKATFYLNLLGQSLAEASDLPETYNGYHFLLLETDEVNAFACPGGIILVTKGLIDLCTSEDELAAVLAHEIGHVENHDGVAAIKGSRRKSMWKSIASLAGSQAGNQWVSHAVTAFNGSVGDVFHTMAKSGYSRKQEARADASAVRILARVGYDPNALVRVLEKLGALLSKDRRGFFKTHPDPRKRIALLKDELKALTDPVPPVTEARKARYAKFRSLLSAAPTAQTPKTPQPARQKRQDVAMRTGRE